MSSAITPHIVTIKGFLLNLCSIGFGPTSIAFFTDKVFRNDADVGNSIGLMISVVAPLSALLLWLALKSCRKSLAERVAAG